MESFGWAVAALLVVLLIVRDAALELVRKLVTAGIGALERRFSGNRWVRRRAVRRYRDDIAERLALVPVPFKLPVRIPMRDVYVPLRASDRPEGGPDDVVDLASAVTAHRHVLVLGPPGSGKSLFLRHLLWTACARPPPGAPIAVLVPLTRLAEVHDVEAAVTAWFAEHGFANAGDFVRTEVRRPEPRLLILFDGLDEVGSGERDKVTALVAAFADAHPAVRFVVTCRTQVYDRALDGTVDEVFHVQPFSDELIERFLRAWPPMSSPAAVDRLVTTLWDTPAVAQLVRNPLLLTMLAYLYTADYDESVRLIPHKRTHFYRDASELLLRRWQQKQNRYEWVAKKVVLQHLALVNQDSRSDRRGIGYAEVLAEIRAVLPLVSVPDEEAPQVLAEIVERSGMLVRLDGGERYQFAHLTMQEYLAAMELLDRPDELLRRYEADPAAWREPVKLWCGGDQDSTEVIQRIAAVDEVLALECLADATRVDDAVADGLIEQLLPRLLDHPTPDPALVRAFGILASDRRPRGRRVFDRLASAGTDQAAAALAASNLSEAAEAIAAHAEDVPSSLDHLRHMGNVAIPALTGLATDGGPSAVDAATTLTAIGTPRAAQALADLLFSAADPAVSRRAAVGLVQLSAAPAVEEALATAELPTSVTAVESTTHDWVWRPFLAGRGEMEARQLQRIFGRCWQLLAQLDEDDLVSIERDLDARLIVALLLYETNGKGRPIADLDIWSSNLRIATRASEDRSPETVSARRAEIAEQAHVDPRLLRITAVRSGLLPQHRTAATVPLHRVTPQIRNWETMTDPSSTFDLSRSLYYRAPVSLTLVVALVSILFAAHRAWTTPGWGRVLYVALLASLAATIFVAVIGLVPIGSEEGEEVLGMLGLSPLLTAFFAIQERSLFPLIYAGVTPAWVYGLVVWLHPPGVGWTIAVVVAYVCLAVVPAVIGVRKAARTRNPLRGLFVLPEG